MKSTEIKMNAGWVLVKPTVQGTDGAITVGDKVIYVPGGYEKSHRAMNVTGMVVHCCSQVNKQINKMNWQPSMIVMERGDIVWYSWTATRNSYGEANRVIKTDDLGECIMIYYGDCYAFLPASRKEDFHLAEASTRVKMLTLLNGFVLTKYSGKNISSQFLVIPDSVKRKRTGHRLMEVVHVGAPNIDYLDKHHVTGEDIYPKDTDCVVWPGDIIVTDTNCDIPLEGDFNQLFGGELFRMQRRNILCVTGDAGVEVKDNVAKDDLGGDYTDSMHESDYYKEKDFNKNLGKRIFHSVKK